MSGGSANAKKPRDPVLVACPLWKKTSAKGKTYLVGRMGGLRVMVMAKRDKEEGDGPTHELLVSAAPSKPRKEGSEQ